MRNSTEHTRHLAISIAQRARTFVALLSIALLLPSGLFSPMRASADDLVPEAAGDLDPSFGVGGKVTTDFFSNLDVADAMAIQSDGKIVAAGVAVTSSDSSTADFALARYNQDGSLDASFGSAGKVTTQFSGTIAQAFSVAIQTDGKIVAGGRALTGSSFRTSDFALARYNTDGTLDASFGSSGKVTTDFFSGEDAVTSIAIQSDGKLIATGFAEGSASEFALVRYNADGSLDTSFGSAGKLATNGGTRAVAIQADGKIVTAGGSINFELARYHTDGSLDPSFGSGGKATTNFFGPPDEANTVAIQSDGKIVAAGLARGSPNPFENFGLARYNRDGSLDSTFGTGGKAATDFGTSAPEGVTSIAIQADGKIVGVGGEDEGFAIARYNGDGSLDTSFGAAGMVLTPLGKAGGAARAVAIQADGRLVVAGLCAGSTSGDFALARYLSPTSTQPDFGLFFNPDTVNVQAGTKVRVTVNISRTGGLTGNITVTPPDPAMGIKAKPSDSITTADNSASFKLKIEGGAPVGPHQLTFSGKDDAGRVRTATVTLIVP